MLHSFLSKYTYMYVFIYVCVCLHEFMSATCVQILKKATGRQMPWL